MKANEHTRPMIRFNLKSDMSIYYLGTNQTCFCFTMKVFGRVRY